MAVFVHNKQLQVRRLSDGALLGDFGTRVYQAENAFASDGGRIVGLFQESASHGDRYKQLMMWNVVEVNPVFFRWPMSENSSSLMPRLLLAWRLLTMKTITCADIDKDRQRDSALLSSLARGPAPSSDLA